MSRYVVADEVPGVGFESVELECVPLQFQIKGPDGSERDVSLRIFDPLTVNGGQNYIEYAFARIVYATRNEECGKQFRLRAMLLGDLDAGRPEIDPERIREFDLSTLDRQFTDGRRRTFDEIRENGQWQELSNREFLENMIGDPGDDSTEQLIEDAIYERPIHGIPLTRERYEEFARQMADEVLSSRRALRKLCHIAFKDHQQEALASGESAARVSTFERRQFVQGLVDKQMPDLLKRAYQREISFGVHFRELVAEARDLHDRVGIPFEETGTADLPRDNEQRNEQLDLCVCRYLDAAAVDDLIDRCSDKLRILFTPNEAEGTSVREDLLPLFVGDRSNARQQIESLQELRASTDPHDKWLAVCHILVRFCDRNECVRMLIRELDEFKHSLINMIHREIYKKIRKHLTPIERRMFLFTHTSLPSLGNRLATFHPAIESFYWGMDEETQGLVWAVCILKIHDWGSRKDLDKLLERRFRTYLRFYPVWIALCRADEAERKKRKHSRALFVSSSKPVGEASELQDVLPDGDAVHPSGLVQLFLGKNPDLDSLAKRFCSPVAARRLLRKYNDGLTEEAIADEEGVSQQAVSKSIKKAREAIVNGLATELTLPDPWL